LAEAPDPRAPKPHLCHFLWRKFFLRVRICDLAKITSKICAIAFINASVFQQCQCKLTAKRNLRGVMPWLDLHRQRPGCIFGFSAVKLKDWRRVSQR